VLLNKRTEGFYLDNEDIDAAAAGDPHSDIILSDAICGISLLPGDSGWRLLSVLFWRVLQQHGVLKIATLPFM